jgi:serralysin
MSINSSGRHIANSVAGLDGGTSGPVGINVDPYPGLVIFDKPVAPLTGSDSVFTHLFSGATLSIPANGIITYGFFTGNHAVGINNNPHNGEGAGYSPFSAAQKAAAISAIQLWDDLIPLTFKNVGDQKTSDWAKNNATILFANTTTGPAQAWAYYPGGDKQYHRVSSDVWTADPNVNPSNGEFGFGQYGRTTLVHEIGHTLGLSHPGDYNFSDDNDGDGQPDPITYAGDAQYFQDSQEYTIMSYFGAWETGGAPIDWRYSGGFFYDNSPQGPMLHDIFAIQQIYGKDMTTRVTDTTYGFHSTAGNDMFDFTKNPLPFYAVYDAGGTNDKIDLSGFTSSQYLNLNAGEFSSIGDITTPLAEVGATFRAYYDYYIPNGTFTDGKTDVQIANAVINGTKAGNAAAIASDTGVSGIGTVNYENFAIAYGVTIEDAVGGQGKDLIVGNDASNKIDGQGGNDVLVGGGNSDTFIFANNGSTDTILDFQTAVDKIDLSALAGVTAADVTYNATTHQVEINVDHTGAADMFINAATVNTGDYIFHA